MTNQPDENRKPRTEIDGLLERCGTNLDEFAHTFRPETFYLPTPTDEDTQRFIRLLAGRAISHALFIAHRGWGKTAWVTTALQQRILYRQENCIMYCSLTEKKAMLETETLKNELERDILINQLFGDMRSEKWSQEEWCTAPLVVNGVEIHPGTQVVPRGMGQQVRGWLYAGKYRPDFIVVDDIQDRKSVKSETLRDEAWQWFVGEVLGCFSQLDELGPKEFAPKLVVIGNMLHEDCVVNRLREEALKPGSIWRDNVLIFPMCDDNLKSLRPSFISDAKVRQIYTQYKNSGDLDTFAQEYQEEVVSKVNKQFRPEYYQYFDEAEEKLSSRGGVETVITTDIANTKKETSCPCGIVAQTVDLVTGFIYVREVLQERLHPDEQVQAAIDMAKRWGARCISCGTQGAKEWATYHFENAIRQQNVPLEFVEIPETRREGAKEERIVGLVPLYRTGVIKHAAHKDLDGTWVSHCIPLELAQAKFPHSRYMDAMDSQSQILWLLDNTGRFMQARDQHQEGATPDEYEELEAEMAAEEDLVDWKVRV